MVRLRKTEGLPPRVLDYKLVDPLISDGTLSFDVDESTFGCLFLLLNTEAAGRIALTNIMGPQDRDIWVLLPETCYQLDSFFGFDIRGPIQEVIHIEIHCDPEKERINDREETQI